MECKGKGTLMSLLFKRIIWGVCCLLLSVGTSHGQEQTRIVLLLSGDSNPYQEVVAGIRSALGKKAGDVSLETVSLQSVAETGLAGLDEIDLLVAVGTRATGFALAQPLDVPVFSTFVTRSSLVAAAADSRTPGVQFPEGLHSAIVLDQPATRVVALTRLIAPQAKRLGTVVNNSATNRLEEFKAAVAQQHLSLTSAMLLEDSNPIRDLKQVFAESDAFVVIPDVSSFNSKTAKWILFLSYRHRIPVIGYSQKYTEAGAAISLFTEPDQVGRDTGEQILGFLKHGHAGNPQNVVRYPRYFSLAVNPTVMDSLGLEPQTITELKQRLLQLESVVQREAESE